MWPEARRSVSKSNWNLRLSRWGTALFGIPKIEVIRGVRLHFIPESYNGSQELYQDITFEKDPNHVDE